MPLAPKALLAAASLALAACDVPPAVVGPTGARDSACQGGLPSAGLYDANLGDPCDPVSIAYFNRTHGNQVLFEVDQTTLTPEGRSILVGQAQWLIANSSYAAVVEGHADEQGTREYNLALGARRAVAVQDFLIGQGVPAGRLRTISYGKERPIEVCSVEACYAKNRRTVTVLSAGPGV